MNPIFATYIAGAIVTFGVVVFINVKTAGPSANPIWCAITWPALLVYLICAWVGGEFK